MDASLLLASCKQGDLACVKYLVEQREIDINIRDKWDSTPLYYACLCGHDDIVRYLLEKGVRCEAHTFDGERCLYGALSIEIRNLLKNFKLVSSNNLSSNFYVSALQRILETGENADIKFVVRGCEFSAHRCILSSRSDYFNEMLHNKWLNRPVVHINHSRVRSSAFKAILQYIYTDEMEILIDEVESCLLLAKQCQLFELMDKINDTIQKTYTFECLKPGTNVKTLMIESNHDALSIDFSVLVHQAMPHKFQQWVGGNELPFLPNPDHIGFEDVCIVVGNDHFFCHKVFLCGRSDYFKALFKDHFMETEAVAEHQQVTRRRLHDISSNIFIQILNYIYQDAVDLTEDVVYDTLCAADIYLLPGLKKQCANFFTKHLTVDNCITILRLAKLFQLVRLENQVVEFMSAHIYQFVEMEDFEELVKEEASGVINREEVDSVPLLDDIRYHITSNVQTISNMDEANDQLAAIDGLLEKLQLDG